MLHYVIVRGIERREIFLDDQDRYHFLRRLGAIIEPAGTVCCAWALIADHFYLLRRTDCFPIAHPVKEACGPESNWQSKERER